MTPKEETIKYLTEQFERTIRESLISDKHLPEYATVRIIYDACAVKFDINFKAEK